MADDIIDSHEQSERAREWLQKNGSSIIMGILLGLALLLGWQRWQQSSVNHRAEALVKFDDLQAAVDKDDIELAGKLVDDLRKNYGDTPHAALAALELAEMHLKAGKLPEAESSLRFAAEAGSSPSIQSISALRLARALVARGEAQKALDALKAVTPGAYVGEVEQVRGDALLALGRGDEARKAFDAALVAMDVGSPQRAMIEARRDDLAAGGAAPAATAAPVQAPTPELKLVPTPESAPAAPAEQG
jgi:predicted negative regulator of RcsB-dependent stress response